MDLRVLTLCAAALSGLAACSTYDPYYSSTPTPSNRDTATGRDMATSRDMAPDSRDVASSSARPNRVAEAPAPITAPVSGNVAAGTAAYRAGYGFIESMSLVYQPTTRGSSASTGGSASNTPDPGPYRMTVRMDDGSLQSLVVDNRSFLVGDRVQLGTDGRVGRL